LKTTLFMLGVKGELRVWSIMTVSDGLVLEHGVSGGVRQVKHEEIDEGKVNRTLEEQIESRYYSRINKMLDKGYKETSREALAGRTNAMGFIKPTLAKPLKQVSIMDLDGAFYQHKYDGNRCLVTKQNGKVLAYGRNSKLIKSVGHILDGIKLEEGQTIDGELYCHGVKLQTINSWIKKEQDMTKNLSLRVYDIVTDAPYSERLINILCMDLGSMANVVRTRKLLGDEDIKSIVKQSIAEGYEGGIIRWGDEGYQDGKRSKYLVKLKVPDAMEAHVEDIIPSNDGWARLFLDCGVTVSCPGDMSFKYSVMENAELYIGKMVTIEYYGLTNKKLPFQPVAIAFRDEFIL